MMTYEKAIAMYILGKINYDELVELYEAQLDKELNDADE